MMANSGVATQSVLVRFAGGASDEEEGDGDEDEEEDDEVGVEGGGGVGASDSASSESRMTMRVLLSMLPMWIVLLPLIVMD